jgi:hypothetical protein
MNERKARELLYQRSSHVCELCSSRRGTNAHHRKPRSLGGLWTPSNLLHLCGSGSTGCHGYVTTNPQIAREQGWSVPSWADPARTPVWIAWREFVFLDDHGNYQNEDGEAA